MASFHDKNANGTMEAKEKAKFSSFHLERANVSFLWILNNNMKPHRRN